MAKGVDNDQRSHPNVPGVDQSDRTVPVNLRQSGPTPVELLISNRVRKSPFWHLAVEAGCWRATVYNRMYHPRGYVRPEHGGAMVEYEALVTGVTLWDVAVERQIRVKGPDAEAFANYVVTRDATAIQPMHGKYCILCNPDGGIVNDPVVLRVAGDEFWFSAADSDLLLWLRGINVGAGFDVSLAEIDVAPLQVQGPRSTALMVSLFGQAAAEVPYYGLMEAKLGGAPVLVSRTGFSGEEGYEVYVRDASLNAETVWYAIRTAGARFGLRIIAPAHHRRIAAGILSFGQDMDFETSPFQVNLGYQVPGDKAADYIGRAALEAQRAEIEAGRCPFSLQLAGMTLGGNPIVDHAPDFWLVREPNGGRVGYLTSSWWSPELGTNIALARVPPRLGGIGTRLEVELPYPYGAMDGRPVEATVCNVPFRPSEHPSARERQQARRR